MVVPVVVSQPESVRLAAFFFKLWPTVTFAGTTATDLLTSSLRNTPLVTELVMSALEDSLKSAFRHETNVILAKRGADNVAASLARDFLQPQTAGGPGDAGALEHRRACSAVTCDADWLLFWQGAYKVCLTRERSSWNHGVVCSLFMAVTVALALNKRAFRRGVGVLSLIMIAIGRSTTLCGGGEARLAHFCPAASPISSRGWMPYRLLWSSPSHTPTGFHTIFTFRGECCNCNLLSVMDLFVSSLESPGCNFIKMIGLLRPRKPAPPPPHACFPVPLLPL